MRYLVTGGAGFIGSHLCEYLLERGNEVVALDNLLTGSRENIKNILSLPGFTFVQGSVMDRDKLGELISSCDAVFHLAAAVGVKFVMDNLVTSIRINIEGTLNVLEESARYGKKVLITSSSEVFGKSKKKFFHEEDDLIIGPPHKVRWCYATSKLLDEFLAIGFHLEKSLPVVIVRLFNVCGPRQTGRYGMVIPRFIQQALRGEPITVYGSGKQIRSFLHVKDAVEGMVNLMERKEAEGKVFNIGNPQGITIEELAFRVREITGSKSPVVYIPYEKVYGIHFEDLLYRVPNISRIQSLIGFSPRYTLEDILRETMLYYKEREKCST